MPVQKLLAKIHIAKKQLALDEDNYRNALESQTGKRSAAVMTEREIIKCINHFMSLGFQPHSKPKKYDDLPPRDSYDATPGQRRLIEVLWHEVYRGNEEKKHLRQFLWNHFKVSEVRFIRDKDLAYKIIEALRAMQNRRTRDTDTVGM
jgi:hypothetical protein